MIKYYKLFDLLNRRGMKKSDLREILSSATVAKLSKGQYISGEAIEKICLFLDCQPGDIMEIVTVVDEIKNGDDETITILTKDQAKKSMIILPLQKNLQRLRKMAKQQGIISIKINKTSI